MNSKIPLYQTPVPSTDFWTDASLCMWGGFPTLRFSYYRDGIAYRSGIRFKRVLATRNRSERCCTEWHIQAVYDTLAEIHESSWVEELRMDIPVRWKDEQEIHHYMIYLDSAGCFEIIAESWEVLPEETGPWE